MPKKIIGLIVAGALALTGGASVAAPATAAPPQPVTAKSKAQAVAAAKARAARQARDDYIADSGARVVATRKAAQDARTRAAAAARAVAPARARAAAAARAATVAKARAAALPAVTKAQAAAKKKSGQAAAAAAQAAARAAAQARASVTALARARARVKATAVAASETWAIYVALAGPRAELAARNAATARARAAAAARNVPPARAQAAAAARALTATRVRAATAAKAVASVKVQKAKKKAEKRAKKKATKKATKALKRANAAVIRAVRASTKANAAVRTKTAAAAKAAALARDMTLAAARARNDAGPNVNWVPTDTVTFNHPRGSKRQKYALINQLNRAIDATPRGGYIRMAMYLLDISSVTNKLLAAWRRGVNVQVLIDDGIKNKHVKKLKRTLGKNKRASSFVSVCDHSCMSQGTSVIHAKFYLFSVAGQSRYVSLVSSGNPYSGNTTKSWNNTHTITRNRTIYDSLSKYFTDMLPDKNDRNYYRVTKSGKYTVYYYPQKIKKSDDLVWMKVLNRVSCGPTAPGYGNRKGRTLIRVANWGWTQPRIDVARRLWKLHNAGCAVQVIVNRARTSKSVLKVLLRRSKRQGKLAVYDAWRDWRKNSIAGLYVHHKFASINGLLSGKNVKMTLTGSQNFTALGTQANNDLVLRVDDARMTDAYNANFALIRNKYSKRMRVVPAFTRPANRVGGV